MGAANDAIIRRRLIIYRKKRVMNSWVLSSLSKAVMAYSDMTFPPP